MADFYNQTAKEVLARLQVDPEQGLHTHEVQKRQTKYGKNTLKMAETPLWRKIIEPFADVFMAILIVAMFLSFLQRN